MTLTFDHRAAGTPERAWRGERLADLPRVSLPGAGDRLTVIAAHPDDESLGAGGLMAAAATRGADITVVVASDGEASHPDSPTRRPADLAVLRRAEVRRAIERLAPSARVVFLGLPDGGLASVAGALTDGLRDAVAGRALVASPWLEDRHRDHAACAAVTAELAREYSVAHWQYPIWAWHWADPTGADLPWDRLARIDLDAESLAAKQAALAEHVSQHTPLSDAPGDEAILPAPMLRHFERDFECFVIQAAPAAEAAYFDRLYAQSNDPWGLAERFYEQRKRNLLMGVLPRRHFQRVFEPGCATGELSVLLRERCTELVAWDGAAAAVRQARARLGATSVEQRRIPDDWPDGSFDLVVLSEVGYYCADLDVLARRVSGSLTRDGFVVACHWRHAAADHPHSAPEVHTALGAGLHRLVRHEEDDFLLDVWSLAPVSVAGLEGIVT